MYGRPDKFEMSDLRMNDRVYVVDSRYGRVNFLPGTVVKVTPTGLADVKLDRQVAEAKPYRFKNDGWQQGGDKYHSLYVDREQAFEDRTVMVERERRLDQARRDFNEFCKEAGRQSSGTMWPKDRIEEAVEQLQLALNKVKISVTSVDVE